MDRVAAGVRTVHCGQSGNGSNPAGIAIGHGWHQRPVIGRPLCRLGRRLPYSAASAWLRVAYCRIATTLPCAMLIRVTAAP
jgi:hypothetical protein